MGLPRRPRRIRVAAFTRITILLDREPPDRSFQTSVAYIGKMLSVYSVAGRSGTIWDDEFWDWRTVSSHFILTKHLTVL